MNCLSVKDSVQIRRYMVHKPKFLSSCDLDSKLFNVQVVFFKMSSFQKTGVTGSVISPIPLLPPPEPVQTRPRKARLVKVRKASDRIWGMRLLAVLSDASAAYQNIPSPSLPKTSQNKYIIYSCC